MNIAKITNRTALVTVTLLVYWVFIFISCTVFDFTIFKEGLTTAFGLSVQGIFAVLTGAIVLNIMYNLTALAEARQAVVETSSTSRRPWGKLFCGSLLLILALLWAGDWANGRQREQQLIAAAELLVEQQQEVVARIADYEFSVAYINRTEQDLTLLGKIDSSFPNITAITLDEIDGKPLLMGFGSYTTIDEGKSPRKVDFIHSTEPEERAYLLQALAGKEQGHRFFYDGSNYRLLFPVATANGVLILQLSDYNRYGSFSS